MGTFFSADGRSGSTLLCPPGVKADLSWWGCFLQEWNGTSFFPKVPIYSDATGMCGCGGFAHSLGWFQLTWPSSWDNVGIPAKELAPVVIAAALWGVHWGGKLVCLTQVWWPYSSSSRQKFQCRCTCSAAYYSMLLTLSSFLWPSISQAQ